MEITSSAFVALCCTLAVLSILSVPVLWDRFRLRMLTRSVTVLMAALLTVFTAGILVNVQGDFFPTWSSLFGGDTSGLVVGSNGVAADVGRNPNHSQVLGRAATAAAHAAPGHGVVVRMKFAGGRSRITREGAVYLPPQYFRPQYADVAFPVLEYLGGSPSTPAGSLDHLRLASFMDQEIAARRTPPTIIVIPSVNPNALKDDECVDAVHGDQDDTYLSTDIRNDVLHAFRARRDRAGWGLAGDSSGGYCAVNLALRHPQWYGAAASMSGYFFALTDVTTGNLYHGNTAVRNENTPLWVVRHRPQPPLALYLSSGDTERDLASQLQHFAALLHPPISLTTLMLHGGGHYWNAWRAQLPPLFDWFGTTFGGPLAPALAFPANATVTTTLPYHPTTHPEVVSKRPAPKPTVATSKPPPESASKLRHHRIVAPRPSPRR